MVAEPEGFSPAAAARLREVADVVLEQCSQEAVSDALSQCDVFWFRLAYELNAATLERSSRCSILATPVTGLDHIDLEACDHLGIRVVSLRGETAFLRDVRATAELTLALTLALCRHLPAAVQHVHDGGWDRDAFRGRELFGKTAGLVGLGRLGSIVAQYFRALGMRVHGYDPHGSTPPGVERVDDLLELVAKSDVVSLHARYESSTHHLVDARVLAAVKQGAILVNTARGGLLDERALLDSLRNGRLAGAALDVLECERHLDRNDPLVAYARANPHLLITPHIGGNTYESFEKTERFLAERVIEALDAQTRMGVNTQ